MFFPNVILTRSQRLLNIISVSIAHGQSCIRLGVTGELGKMLQKMPKKILIVEDNELNMKLFSDLLDAHGYETAQTREGLKAISLAREFQPDLILMDIQLPEVSGLEVTKWIKNDDNLAEIPIIAVTAFAMKGDEKRIRDGGCAAYISKPISVVSFLSTVRKFVDLA